MNSTLVIASKKIAALELTQTRASLPKELSMDVFSMSKEDVQTADLSLQPGFLDFLEQKGVLSRALQAGKRLREDPAAYLKQLDDLYHAKANDTASGLKFLE